MRMHDDILYPNVWGEKGALFAFSRIDGTTDIDSQLICALHNDGEQRGLLLHTAIPAELTIEFNGSGPVSYEDEVVAGDIVIFNAISGNSTIRCELVAVQNETIAIRLRPVCVESGVKVSLSLRMQDAEVHLCPESLTLLSGDSSISLTVVMGDASVCGDAIIFSPQDGSSLTCILDYQTSRSNTLSFGFVPDIDSIIASRLQFLNQLPVLSTLDPLIKRTFAKCASVQKINCCTAQRDVPFNWTTPDRWPHKYMWIWDSAFHALGLRHLASDWAMDSLRAVVSKIQENGFLPHMMAPDSSIDSGIIQPLILAWASWRVYEKTADVSFLKGIYHGVANMLLYDMNIMDTDNDGLSEWGDKCASGMDNSPRFDQPIGAAVDLNAFIANDLLYLAKIAETLGMPGEAAQWMKERSRLSKLINDKLWDPEIGFYCDLDSEGNRIPLKAVSGFTPLFAGICSCEQAETLHAHLTAPVEFWRPFPVPSVAADEPSFSNDMWRGPTWINYNYMIIEGLIQYSFTDTAFALKQKVVNEIARWYNEDGIIYEYYDSEGAVSPSMLNRKGHKPSPEGAWPLGICIRDYHWTASLFVDLMMQ